jgi:hypothetical protein
MSSGVAVNAALLALVSTCALAEENRLGCNFDGGLTWLALGTGKRGSRVGFLPR